GLSSRMGILVFPSESVDGKKKEAEMIGEIDEDEEERVPSVDADGESCDSYCTDKSVRMAYFDPWYYELLQDNYLYVNMTKKRFAMLVLLPFAPDLLYATRRVAEVLKEYVDRSIELNSRLAREEEARRMNSTPTH
ncbi:hypothetical protein Tsubulata_031331, partial [Turnera subulata]